MYPISNTKPLLCPELVGREHQLQELSQALHQAAHGKSQFLVLAGEAGLGKSRLCQAFMERSLEQHALVLFGRAIRQDSSVPFGLFLDAFRHYFVTSVGSSLLSAPAMQIAFAPLARLLPELAPLLPQTASPLSSSMSTPLHQQQSLFRSVLNGMQVLTQMQHAPLLLLLEDLHWADETSLDLLAFLVQRLNGYAAPEIASSSLLIIGTYRSEALSENSALLRLLVQLRGQRQISELRLTPLNADEHRRFVSSTLNQQVPNVFADFLFAWDEGNPFFTEEILGAMAYSGQLQSKLHTWLIPHGSKLQFPPSLAAAILERYMQLPAVDRGVLDYAAVIGRTFDFRLLAALCDIGEHDLVEVLRRALHTQLIRETSISQTRQMTSNEPERYQFRHALTREAIYDRMLIPERRLRHRAVAETLERITKGTSDGLVRSAQRVGVTHLLAEHYCQAGLLERARPYALREAEYAGQVFAFHEERYYLDMAQASLPEDDPERLQLLERLAILSSLVFDIDDAFHWLTEVKSGYQRIGRPQRAALLMARLFLISFLLSGTPPMHNLMAEVEALAEAALGTSNHATKDEDLLFASSLLAVYYILDSKHNRANIWIERGIVLYKSLTGSQKEAAFLPSQIARLWIKFHEQVSTAAVGLEEVRSILDKARQQGQPDMIVLSIGVLVSGLIGWGRTDEAEQALKEVSAYELPSDTAPQKITKYLLGWHRFFSGDQWEQTIEQMRREVGRVAEPMEQINLSMPTAIDQVVFSHFLLAQNELFEAQGHLETAQPKLEMNNLYTFLVMAWWGFAKLCALQGKLIQAEEWYDRLFQRWKSTEDTCLILPTALDAIEFYADIGNLVKARQWLIELERIMLLTDNPVAEAAFREAQGAVRAKEGALEQAVQALRQAVKIWDRLKRRYQQALASQRLAEVLLDWATRRTVQRAARQAARGEAEMLLGKALAVYERLQLPTRVAAVQELRSNAQLEAQLKRSRTLKTRRTQQDLTQREMQVLVQLAAGHTNREVATLLGMSVGTVGVHVGHILSKLDCTTRTQAVAYALAKGWVSSAKET